MKEKQTKRLLYIDLARTYAIFLALLSHVFVSIGFFDQMGTNGLLVKQFTRMATPMFVFMFGFMVQFIYVKRSEKLGINNVNKRIYIRSFQCYVAYGLTSFSAFLGGYKSIEGFFASLFFITDSRFGNILRAYSIILLITPFIIKLRIKFGIKFLFISLGFLIMTYGVIHNSSSIDFGIFNHHFSILLGIGLHKGGPSILGALSFFMAGMIFASSIQSLTGKLNWKISSVLLSVLLVLGFFLIEESFNDMWVYFSDGIYRKNNSPGYYIIGIIGSLLTIILFYLFTGSKSPSRITRFLLPIGTSSLISYTAGNIILNVIDVKSIGINQFVYIFLFFVSVIFITAHIERIPFYKEMNNVMNLKFSKSMIKKEIF